MKQKFEKPVIEIEHFEAQDVIVTSNGAGTSQVGTIVGEEGGICVGDKRDNYNFDNCL